MPSDSIKYIRALETSERFTALDVETTGLNRTKCAIVDIAVTLAEPWVVAYQLGNGRTSTCVQFREVTGFFSKIKPPTCADVESKASEINGFDWPLPAAWQDAPLFLDAWPSIKPFLDGVTVIGHNPSFDIDFVDKACCFYGIEQASIPYRKIDTCALSKVVSIAKGQMSDKHSLDEICNRAGIQRDQIHTALGDVKCTVRALNWLIRESGIQCLT